MKTDTRNPAAVALGRLGGSKRSPRKAEAARRNALARWEKERIIEMTRANDPDQVSIPLTSPESTLTDSLPSASDKPADSAVS